MDACYRTSDGQQHKCIQQMTRTRYDSTLTFHSMRIEVGPDIASSDNGAGVLDTPVE